MSAATSTPHALKLQTRTPQTGTLKRKLQVFVEIPPSPLHTSTPCSLRHAATPLASKALNTSTSTSNVISGAPLKKLKIATDNIQPITHKFMSATTKSEADQKFPNGHFHCHQCRKYRDIECKLVNCFISYSNSKIAIVRVQCSEKQLKSGKNCPHKYCKKCLSSRYDQHFDNFLNSKTQSGNQRDASIAYIWR